MVMMSSPKIKKTFVVARVRWPGRDGRTFKTHCVGETPGEALSGFGDATGNETIELFELAAGEASDVGEAICRFEDEDRPAYTRSLTRLPFGVVPREDVIVAMFNLRCGGRLEFENDDKVGTLVANTSTFVALMRELFAAAELSAASGTLDVRRRARGHYDWLERTLKRVGIEWV